MSESVQWREGRWFYRLDSPRKGDDDETLMSTLTFSGIRCWIQEDDSVVEGLKKELKKATQQRDETHQVPLSCYLADARVSTCLDMAFFREALISNWVWSLQEISRLCRRQNLLEQYSSAATGEHSHVVDHGPFSSVVYHAESWACMLQASFPWRFLRPLRMSS